MEFKKRFLQVIRGFEERFHGCSSGGGTQVAYKKLAKLLFHTQPLESR